MVVDTYINIYLVVDSGGVDSGDKLEIWLHDNVFSNFVQCDLVYSFLTDMG